MKITKAFCDVHPNIELRPAELTTLSPFGDLNKLNTAACTHEGCNRHFTREYGYFTSAVGERTNLENMAHKHRCGWNHHVEHMIVTTINDALVWACPHENCSTLSPYQLPGFDALHQNVHEGRG